MNAQNKTLAVDRLIVEENFQSHRLLLVETDAGRDVNNLASRLMSQAIDVLETLCVSEMLVSKVQRYKPDVLLLSVDFLDAAMLDELIKVNQTCPLPVTVFAKQHSPQVLKTVVGAGVSSYVVDDVQEHRLPIIIDLAVARFEQMHSLHCELKQTKDKLNERKIIERAKGIIMQQKELTEEEAYVQMRKTAMNQGQPMVELAKKIIAVSEMFSSVK